MNRLNKTESAVFPDHLSLIIYKICAYQLRILVSDWQTLENIYLLVFYLTQPMSGDWDCVAAVEHLPALHYSVYFIFLSFGIMGFIVKL